MRERNSNFIHNIIEEDLESGRVKKVITRFPPEPNGYLHIGSVKAIWVNWNAARTYGGRFNLRYDDTNPVREDDEYVKSIEEDLRWLGIIPDGIFFGSDYFEQCYDYALQLIRQGDAFVCDLSSAEISETRGKLTVPGIPSPYRDRSVNENLDLFERMKNGEFPNGARTLRGKIDMASPNINMRDPVLYRIMHMSHHRQGNKWCIYPMYDFAHTIQDAIEGITHSCCSIEFENHRPLYNWVAQKIGFEFPPHQYEFSRLNITFTVMSKRYLRKLVETGIVDGWDDPRMPTLCGLRRRGYTPSAILDFVERLGVSKANSTADIKLLEYCLCEELNRTVPRRVAVLEPLRIKITNLQENHYEEFELPNNHINSEAGNRKVSFTSNIFIERSDFMEVPVKGFHRLSPGGEVRLMGAYICRCDKVIYDENGQVIMLECSVDLKTVNGQPWDGRKIKGTVHWLSEEYAVKTEIRLVNNLFTQENVDTLLEDDQFEALINPDSLKIVPNALIELSLKNVEPGSIFQFVRQGYFCRDFKSKNVWIRTAQLKSGWKN